MKYSKNHPSIIFRLVTIILFLILTRGIVQSADFYVAPNGHQSNPGTQQYPFATIDRALDAVKEIFRLTPEEDCTIWLEEGHYYIAAPLVLRSEEFRNNTARLTISALPDKTPQFQEGWN